MADEPTKAVDAATGTPFKGHEWDGIRELDTPLPRWWRAAGVAQQPQAPVRYLSVPYGPV